MVSGLQLSSYTTVYYMRYIPPRDQQLKSDYQTAMHASANMEQKPHHVKRTVKDLKEIYFGLISRAGKIKKKTLVEVFRP